MPRRGLTLIAVVSLTVAGCSASAAEAATTRTFGFTGAEQTFVVPIGVTNLHVVAVGARGGTGGASTNLGGLGGLAVADLSVTPEEVLYIEVGGNGSNGPGDASGLPGGSGGFNGGGVGGSNRFFGTGGGGGGGASDVRTMPRSLGITSLLSRVVTAGGGGGSGGTNNNSGGAGGAAGFDGGDALSPTGSGGDGATPTAPGAGGGNGATGSRGTGGAGGTQTANSGSGGGGAGGGAYGGGGGSAGTNGNADGGGGGGGSTAFGARATNRSAGLDATGVPSVTLTYSVLVPVPAGTGQTATGLRAGALKKCKKRYKAALRRKRAHDALTKPVKQQLRKQRRKCAKKANQLPV